MNIDKKWQFYLNKRIDLFKSFIENFSSTKDYKIKSIETNIPYFLNNMISVNFYFDSALNKEQKVELKIYLLKKIIPLYERCLNNSIDNESVLFFRTKVYFCFLELNENTPSNMLTFYIPKNNWKALALSEDTQYLPILSNNKNL